MRLDRRLIDTIKKHFAGKSSAQLQEIVRAGDRDRWSEEAFVAAREVLLDRSAGRAQAPEVPVEDPPPPPAGGALDSLLVLATACAAGLMGGGIVLDLAEHHPDPDQPVPFGTDVAWLAVESTDTRAVAVGLGLRGAREATWGEGVAAARRSLVFVTPPVGDWTLAVSAALFPPRRSGEFIKPLLERLSRRFGDAQYYCTHGGAGLYAWARCRSGRLVRGYGWLGRDGLALWDEGALTREERGLGLGFQGELPPAAEQGGEAGVTPPEEGDVLQLASYWSVDPTTLDEHFKEPVMGLLGRAGWTVAEPSAAADPAG
jgi:hypothetical protein